jgi:hypothetical protein
VAKDEATAARESPYMAVPAAHPTVSEDQITPFPGSPDGKDGTLRDAEGGAELPGAGEVHGG